MSMERTDYPGLLKKLQPSQAVDVLNDRVAQVKRLNTSIADWLQERMRLEEQYAAGLRKLARKPIDDMDLGIFSVPWSTLTDSMNTLAESHASMASRIEVDVERPLREFAATNRQMQGMTTIQGNLASMAKDFDRAQEKTEKLGGKGDRADANKVANASSDLDNAKAQWDSQAPYVFETLQALDETRVNLLRDHLTQFVTLEVDQVERSRVAAEQSLNILLNVETADEIKTFALKALAAKPTLNRAQRSTMLPHLPIPSRGGSSSGPSQLAPSQSIPDDESQFPGGTPEPTKKKFGGLKRLGTVMSRRSSKMPQPLPATSESPERKPKSSPFGRLGRNKGSYSDEPSASQRPQSPMRLGSEVMEPPSSRHASVTPSSQPPQMEPNPRLANGSASAGPPLGTSFANGSHQGDLADLEPPRAAQSETPVVPTLSEPRRDSQGFSVPPPILDPISQAQADANELSQPQFNVNIRNAPIREEGGDAALATMANTLQAPPINSRRLGTVRGRRDARNSAIVSSYGPPGDFNPDSLSIAPPPTAERSEPAAALPITQGMQPPPDASSSSPLSQSTSSFSPAGAGATAFSPSASFAEPQDPIRAKAPVLASDHTGDNQSIRSGRSLQSTTSQATRHPELHEIGLGTSIIETVSARFENGQLATSSLIGEIALVYNPANFSTSLGHETIRLENFSSLERVAPNPAFINQITGREGQYSVTLANVTRQQIAFKYQIRHENAATQIPLLMAPALRIEPTQTMVIVSYSLHPSFNMQGRESINLTNVTIALTLEGAKATSCQSKPVGTFARENNLIYWQLGDITLRPAGAPEKLLAKFATESEATGGHVEGRWEITADGEHGLGSSLALSMQGVEGAADPFADESAAAAGSWKPVPTVRKLASGSYVAKS